MRTTRPTPETRDRTGSDQHRPRRPRHGVIAGTVAVAAGTAALAAAPVVPSLVAGLNLGNHNETLLAPDVLPRRTRRTAVALVVAGMLGAGFIAATVDTSDATGGVHPVAKPGQYHSSSGGGGTA